MKRPSYLLIGLIISTLLAGCSQPAGSGSGQGGSAGAQFVNEHLVFAHALYVPPLLQPRLEKGEKIFDLDMQSGATEFFAGKQTATLGFNGAYLGPTIRANSGDKVRLNVTNRLSETTTVHWHGMHLPAVMDGGPHQIIAPGATWQPYWTITNQAATLWYHPHLMGKTGEQVYRGLAGLFIVDDANSAALDLPGEYGIDDIPLIVQDRLFDPNGQLIYQMHGPNPGLPPAAGMIGDTILVNGTVAPYVDLPRTLVRLRLLNASNGRRYNFGFADNYPFYQIASDGGLLEAPVQRTRLLLGAAERAEILVDLRDTSGPLTLLSYAVIANNDFVSGIAKGTFGPNAENQQFKILELRPQAGDFAARSIPAQLNTIKRLDAAAATQTRRFSLDSNSINGKEMDPNRIDVVVQKGAVEIWEVRNESPLYHPFHVHDVQFLVLSRNGQAPPAWEQGWKDTVIVDPAETVRLIMQFTDYADPHMPSMFHCHILEHEDMGMMGQFVVVDNLSDPVGIAPQSGGALDGHPMNP